MKKKGKMRKNKKTSTSWNSASSLHTYMNSVSSLHAIYMNSASLLHAIYTSRIVATCTSWLRLAQTSTSSYGVIMQLFCSMLTLAVVVAALFLWLRRGSVTPMSCQSLHVCHARSYCCLSKDWRMAHVIENKNKRNVGNDKTTNAMRCEAMRWGRAACGWEGGLLTTIFCSLRSFHMWLR